MYILVSKSNIVILGSCRGSVYAGATGDRNCFIAAFVMKPVQIRIADKAARSAITKYSDQTEYKPEPKIAYIKENHIHVVFGPYVEFVKNAVDDHLKK